jgi:hypothetical protein
MHTRTKRTYNLSEQTVATVKRLVEELHLARSQDALVEQAIAEYARRARDVEEARLWEQAATDSEFQAEIRELEAEFTA